MTVSGAEAMWAAVIIGVGWGFAISFFIGYIGERREKVRLQLHLDCAMKTSEMYEGKLTEAWKKLYPASAHLL